jgi:4-alpha-glucanotransferase
MKVWDALADRMGIEAEFVDARGVIRQTSTKTQQALLAAMGIAAGDKTEATAAFEALDREEWLRPLPPVRVAIAEAVTVDVTVEAKTDTLTWQLDLESGEQRSGSAQVDTLDIVDRKVIDGRRLERRRLMLNELPWGYHRLTVQPGDGTTVLIATPGICWLPPAIPQGHRLWGLATQLYLLRSVNNWGIGDFGDLRSLTAMLAKRSADIVGVNPLHALFVDAPEYASPYSPASRMLLNVLNIDVAGLEELSECAAARALISSPAFINRLKRCRAASLVDYTSVAALKLPVLTLLFASSHAEPEHPRWQAFEEFRRDGGDMLEHGCRFLALRQHFSNADPNCSDWHGWPEAYRNPSSPEVAQFIIDHADLVTFHAWLQFLADRQLASVAEAAKDMAVGLYRDLAVGVDRSGAETWVSQHAVVEGVQVGAPPDILNPAGQGWGLPPFHPRALREEAYQSFIDLLRANMRHAGGLRIDHIMGLQHLYWIPAGSSPKDGAYVRYDLEDLIGILALESQRHRCLVIGEDLGTVPDGFRDRMAEACILSYRVLFFERSERRFLPPQRYPKLALAVAGSHDLPTLRGWWAGDDISRGIALDHLTGQAAIRAREEREHDRQTLLTALAREGLLPAAIDDNSEVLIQAIHGYLADTASAIAMAQIDDVTQETSPVNMPGTVSEYPNWRRRLSMTLEEMDEGLSLNTLASIFETQRGRASRQAGPNQSSLD